MRDAGWHVVVWSRGKMAVVVVAVMVAVMPSLRSMPLGLPLRVRHVEHRHVKIDEQACGEGWG